MILVLSGRPNSDRVGLNLLVTFLGLRLFLLDLDDMVIPSHGELDTGTLRAIFRQASRFIPEDQLRKEFYSE